MNKVFLKTMTSIVIYVIGLSIAKAIPDWIFVIGVGAGAGCLATRINDLIDKEGK